MIGFRTVVEALQLGYRVRAAVRKEEGFEQIKAAKSIQPFAHQLEYVIVPDILIEGAYDEAVKGVDYVIHLASPISHPENTDYENDLIKPAVKGTVGMLTSAKKEPKIKRIVITSSIVGNIPWSNIIGIQDTVFTEKSAAAIPSGPFTSNFQAYCASKVSSLVATEEFVEKERPHYEVSTIHPSFVIGRAELVTDPKLITRGTNGAVMRQLLGIDNPVPAPSTSVHLLDVAKLHVLALDPKVAGGQRFFASSQGPNGSTWAEAIDIVKKHFPDEVAKGVFPLGGVAKTKPMLIDSSHAEKTFGFKFRSFEEQVVSVAGHYAELVAAQG